MIILEKQLSGSENSFIAAGEKQESNVAFYLRRAYKDHPKVMVFNDVKLSHNNENAQIDHLIVYPYGFILIESKSITGEVKVNQYQEWSRSYRGQWQGVSSPIKQVELQESLLKDLLRAHKSSILSKILNIKQQGFGGRCWDRLCAISSNAIIDRKHIPKNINRVLVKSEFLVEKLNSIMNLKNFLFRTINVLDTRPTFNKKELNSICDFLLNQCNQEHTANELPSENKAMPFKPKQIVQTNFLIVKLTCKHCGNQQTLTPLWGKYGYYVKCSVCNNNTSMKHACPCCEAKTTKVSKRGDNYTLQCQNCTASIPIELPMLKEFSK